MRRWLAWTSAVVVWLSAPDAAAARLIAVLPLDVTHAEGQLKPAGRADLEEMLRDIAADTLGPQGWTVLTGETTLQVLQDNGVDASRCGDENCSLSMAREIKADKFLSGNVRYVDGLFTASIRLVDTATGCILSSASIEGANERALREDLRARSAEFFARGGLTGAAEVTPELKPAPLTLAPEPKAAKLAAAQPLPAAKPRPPGRGAGVAALVVGALGLVAGVVLTATAQSDAASLRQHPPATGTLESAQASVNARVTGSIVAFAAGGALAAAGIGLTVAF